MGKRPDLQLLWGLWSGRHFTPLVAILWWSCHMAPCPTVGLLPICAEADRALLHLPWRAGAMQAPRLGARLSAPSFPLGSGCNPCRGRRGLSNTILCSHRGTSPFVFFHTSLKRETPFCFPCSVMIGRRGAKPAGREAANVCAAVRVERQPRRLAWASPLVFFLGLVGFFYQALCSGDSVWWGGTTAWTRTLLVQHGSCCFLLGI